MYSALITGVAGQDAFYLYHALLKLYPGVYLTGLYRGQDETRLAALQTAFPDMEIVRGDLTDERSLRTVIEEHGPDVIFNLAGVTSVPLSLKMPRTTYEINTQGVLNLLAAVKDIAPETKVFQASTSEMFGNSPDVVNPLCESSYMLPTSPYGISKLAAHLIVREYRKSYGIHASCAISFNHESVRRPPIFVTRKVTKAAARIALGLQSTLDLGNLDAHRDWGFAGDYVMAFIRMMEQASPDDYVIGTGRAHSIRDLVRVAFEAVGISDYDKYVKITEAHKRPEDNNYLCADPTKAREILGWEATTTFEEMITEMVKNDLQIEGQYK